MGVGVNQASERSALVTGVSRGIGRAVAVRLAAAGYRNAGCYSTPSEAADKTRAEVEGYGVATHFAACDVRDPAAVDGFIAAAEDAVGPITALVNNAGIVRDRPMVLMTAGEWQDVIDVNLTGTFNVCRAVTYRFLKRRAGAVVNISSVAGVYGNAAQTNYAAAKASSRRT
jgi:3-oxoacyl-[acyl-carrier protein] reductase